MENANIKFPLSFLIAILSYTFILIIEKLAFDTHKWLEVHVHPDIHHHDHKKSKLKQKKQEASTFLGTFFHFQGFMKFLSHQSQSKGITLVVTTTLKKMEMEK